jgi:hypothetical protein
MVRSFPFSFTVCTMRHTWPYIFQPDHLQPRWPRIFYDHLRSHRWLRIFYTSKMSITGNFEPYRWTNTQETNFTTTILNMLKTISFPTLPMCQFFSGTRSLLEDPQLPRRKSREKNHEHSISVHVSLTSLQQGDHPSNLRIMGAYMFGIFVISESVPGLFCFRFRNFSVSTSFSCLFTLLAFMLYSLLDDTV